MSNPAGEVQLIQSALISDNAGYGTEVPGNVVDGDATTDYGSAAGGGNTYVGYDAGATALAVPTRALYMPRVGISGNSPYWPDTNVQGVDPATGTARYPRWQGSILGVTYDTFSPTPDSARYVFEKFFNEYTITTSTGYRYLRMLTPNFYAETAEQRWYVSFSLSTNILCKPCRPIITPGGGRYVASQTFAITNPTTNAIHAYTTDGSTPTFDASGSVTNGTLYSSAFTLPTSTTAEITLKVLAYQDGCTTKTSEVVTQKYWCPGVQITDAHQYTGSGSYPAGKSDPNVWDVNGFPLCAHSGSCYWSTAKSKYILVGFSTWLATKFLTVSSDIPPRGIWMYTSPDPGPSGVFAWTPVTTLDATPRTGMVLPVDSHAWTGTDHPLYSQTRSRIYINPSPSDANKKCVMYNHLDDQTNNYASGWMGVATAPDEYGPWTWQTPVRPVIGGVVHRINDLTLVQDPSDISLDSNGAPWIVSTIGPTGGTNNKYVYFLQLDPATDYTSFKGSGGNTTNVPLFNTFTGSREGLAVWNYLGKWIAIHGDLFAYGSTSSVDNRYRISTTASGTILSSVTFADTNPTSDTSIWSSAPVNGTDNVYHMQPTYIFPVRGKIPGSYVLMCDYWSGVAPDQYYMNESSYCWYPILPGDFTLTGGAPSALSIPKTRYSWDNSIFTSDITIYARRRLGSSRTGSRGHPSGIGSL